MHANISNQIPCAADIATLPRYARLAYSIRCARRAEPLVRVGALNPAREAELVRGALDRAEALEGGDRSAPAYDRAALCGCIWGLGGERSCPAYFAMYAAWSVLESAEAEARQEPPSKALSALRAAGVVHDCYDAALALSGMLDPSSSPLESVVEAVLEDLDRLYILTSTQRWSDATRVPASVFGDLWPLGAPKSWPVSESAFHIGRATPESGDLLAPAPCDVISMSPLGTVWPVFFSRPS